MTNAEDTAIPGFGGEIFAPGDRDYNKKRHQYATSSYEDQQGKEGRMHPCLVAFPRRDTDDIGAAIKYAKANNKYIVARSGGHQYCGLSSGGEDTILLSMDHYDHLEVIKDGDKTYAKVGAGKRLTKIAEEFKNSGVTIPHGECPLVAIGGHVQTGGYGHLLRSYGLALDHVHEFKIFVDDGTLKTVQRPSVQDKNGLFWGVLGGGPGSFGVVTEITFECIRDKDHPHSWGYAGTFVYQKSLFLTAMKEIKRWTEMVANGDSSLPPDVDMCMTVASDKILGRGAFLLELVDGNKDGKDDGGANRRFLKKASENVLSGKSFWNRGLPCVGFEGDKSLSFMADAFVRRTGTTDDGREFPQPYKKRLNCTKRPLDTAFVNAFVDLLDRVVTSNTVNLVFQMFIGGGAYASPEPNPPLNSICHRDVTLGIVFDCFYKSNGLKDAENFQAEMEKLLPGFSGEQEVRMLWGSFGDVDISVEKIRKCYYDDETWKDLQSLKKQVDKGDLFHTEFTVQLP